MNFRNNTRYLQQQLKRTISTAGSNQDASSVHVITCKALLV